MHGLIIGRGEVGGALWKILSEFYVTAAIDKGEEIDFKPEIIHITFPYSDNFIKYVKEYQEKYQPKYTVIHSTVPTGTSRKCGAIHSPIRGLHPNLEGGIRTFAKFLGGEGGGDVSDYFRRAGIKIVLFDSQETTEALKLFDTEYYRTAIEFAHRVKRYCDKHNLNFHEVYTLANQTYNEGYLALGYPEFVRPVLQPIMKPIGGHCVVPNSQLIKLSE